MPNAFGTLSQLFTPLSAHKGWYASSFLLGPLSVAFSANTGVPTTISNEWVGAEHAAAALQTSALLTQLLASGEQPLTVAPDACPPLALPIGTPSSASLCLVWSRTSTC